MGKDHIVKKKICHPDRTTHRRMVPVGHRKGDWKLILNPNPKQLQLFNLKNDLGEGQNRAQNPEFKSVVEDLMDTVTAVAANGRTTPGPVLQNDGSKQWRQLYWMESRQ
jgi:hypothetical protein